MTGLLSAYSSQLTCCYGRALPPLEAFEERGRGSLGGAEDCFCVAEGGGGILGTVGDIA